MGRRPGKAGRGAYGQLVRVALDNHQELPELTFRKDALFRSMNDRLGAILLLLLDARVDATLDRVDPVVRAAEIDRLAGIGQAGETFEPLRRDYLGALLACAIAAAEDHDAEARRLMGGNVP